MEDRRVSDLSPHPFNIQVYGQPDDGLRDSLAEFGLSYPIEVDLRGRILSGARRWRAAKALGWKTIPTTRVVASSEAEAQKYILLANHYRSAKNEFTRKQEADAFRRLLDEKAVDPEQLVSLARDHNKAPKGREGHKPQNLAAAAAGLSPTVYRETSFIVEPERAEATVKRARDNQEISESQARSIRRKIRKHRTELKRGRGHATHAARKVRDQLRDAKEEHGFSLDERRTREVDKKVKSVVRLGGKFADELRGIQHQADLPYMTAQHALLISSVFVEVQDAVRGFLHKTMNVVDTDGRELIVREAGALIDKP